MALILLDRKTPNHYKFFVSDYIKEEENLKKDQESQPVVYYAVYSVNL